MAEAQSPERLRLYSHARRVRARVLPAAYRARLERAATHASGVIVA